MSSTIAIERKYNRQYVRERSVSRIMNLESIPPSLRPLHDFQASQAHFVFTRDKIKRRPFVRQDSSSYRKENHERRPAKGGGQKSVSPQRILYTTKGLERLDPGSGEEIGHACSEPDAVAGVSIGGSRIVSGVVGDSSLGIELKFFELCVSPELEFLIGAREGRRPK